MVSGVSKSYCGDKCMHQNKVNAVILKVGSTGHSIHIAGNLLETQILRLHPRPTDPESLRLGPSDPLLHALPVTLIHALV